MIRDLFRGIIRTSLAICMLISCGESFYYMGEMTKLEYDYPQNEIIICEEDTIEEIINI